MARPTWDEYYMQMAELAATRSTCLRRNVGAVIVVDNHAVATGYNGAPKAMGHAVEGGTIYVTHQPCVICSKMIINAGIKRIVVKEGYPDDMAVEILEEAGLKAVMLGDK